MFYLQTRSPLEEQARVAKGSHDQLSFFMACKNSEQLISWSLSVSASLINSLKNFSGMKQPIFSIDSCSSFSLIFPFLSASKYLKMYSRQSVCWQNSSPTMLAMNSLQLIFPFLSRSMLFIITCSSLESGWCPSFFKAFSISVTEMKPSLLVSIDLNNSAKGSISLAGSCALRKPVTIVLSFENLVTFFMRLKSSFNCTGASMVSFTQGCSRISFKVNRLSTPVSIFFIKSLKLKLICFIQLSLIAWKVPSRYGLALMFCRISASSPPAKGGLAVTITCSRTPKAQMSQVSSQFRAITSGATQYEVPRSLFCPDQMSSLLMSSFH